MTNRCLWCNGLDTEPFDLEDAYSVLCRAHVAEYEGVSLSGLDRLEAQQRADMTDLGYLD